MFILQNDMLRITVKEKGAELVSLYHKKDAIEYIWSGNPAFWAKHSPVLFPIVGALKNDTYYYNNKLYHLSRHGFARDRQFTLSAATASELCFTLESDAGTLQQFPFEFKLDMIYRLQQNGLTVMYRVTNTGSGNMYFSVGGHPAFSVPFVEGTDYNDYYLEFNEPELAGRWPISANGLIENDSAPLLVNTQKLPLRKELFYRDALVFKNLRSRKVRLLSNRHNKGIAFDFAGFPYLGIWAAKDADFVCIEPWCGIADPVTSNQQLPDKEGINRLAPQAVFERSWGVGFEI
ncbi:aldose 1-epimerase family protein [Agriterribacter sp.]|uniref:aldose 1-epimerase family protein n=1 Tax=Agriterribacter sp. TaxID=2821509 RepID=UPI002CF2E8C1|nr:aldose 1-epimerase family protein [Agriterribacter sp.]HTN06555.1 aldose 1-epimerase family protein [Agriterribacter sp.]